uniref:Serpentine receptor class gamma n=2 Tax=Bursaphelenchus xylophilus TaxID=6326 RepID=A0A1I7RIQ7_BURXY
MRWIDVWRKYLPVLLAFHFAAPFCLYSFIFWNNGTIECAYKNGQVEGCMLNYDHTVLLFGFLYIIHINQFLFLVIPIISALLNLIALVLLYSRKRLLKSQRTWKHEINLSLNTAATFISHVGYGLITQRILLPYTKLDLGFVTFVLGCVIPLIQDASIFIMVTSLLIASERLRSEVLKIFVKPWMIASWGSKFSSTLSPQLGTVFNARS